MLHGLQQAEMGTDPADVLQSLKAALEAIDLLGLPGHIGAHLDLAIARLSSDLGEEDLDLKLD